MHHSTSSLNQGMQYAKMTSSYHGGRRKKSRSGRKMSNSKRGGSLKKSRRGRKMSKRGGSLKKSRRGRNSKRTQRGGGSFFTPFSEYPTAFDSGLPKDLLESARISSLDAKFAELPAVQRAAGVPTQSGGNRKRKNRRTHRGGQSPIDAPSMLLSSPDEEAAARLNPQWYTENTVIPNFRGPVPVPGDATPAPSPKMGGRRRKSRKYKMMRK